MRSLTDAERATVEANVGLVTFCLRRWPVPERDWSDAHQDGMVGLARAAQKFDPSLGYRFSTYATWWVRQAIQQGRSRVEGANYRRSLSRNGGAGDYEAPLSLDHGEPTIADRFPAADDPESDACATVEGERLLSAALALCRDDVDRRIVVAWARGVPPSTLIGEMEPSAVRTRVERLRARLRHPAIGLRARSAAGRGVAA